jgi:Flp pilus assembly protein TadG
VEFTLVLPIVLVLVMSIAEIGLAIGNNMSLELATREGARVGASLANGGGTPGCGSGLSPNWATVDPAIMASVERALKSPGSGVDMSMVTEVHIYQANSSGGEGIKNVWTYNSGHFTQSSVQWQACARNSALGQPSLGVSITYRYKLVTPLAILTGMFGTNEISMTDRTVMALEPSQ